MTKRQTRLFFYGGTGFFSLVFLVLTFDTHRQVDRLTNADQITPAVIAGKHVWHRKNCINCHTLLGEGAYYAPDLTKITDLRGDAYLRAFLKDPARFYSEQQHRRLMPNQNLSDQDIGHVLAFLQWVARIDNQGWPPRPILVTGSAIPGLSALTRPDQPVSSDPVSQGDALFHQGDVGCFACHSTAPGVNMVGPSMAGLAERTEKTLESPAYGGTARTVEEYVRESILTPSKYLVPGANYSSEGTSLMPAHFAESLQPAQVDALVAYLMTLK
jgi:nitric oxide reductase subunit C